MTLGLETQVVDRAAYDRALARLREARVLLPTFAQLADPTTIPAKIQNALARIDPDAPQPLNLFRVHWFNDHARMALTSVPGHFELPAELTGVKAKIAVALGDRFPMIHAHKVLAAYGCLAPRLVTGQFDPTRQRAVWPSTGNYCRGGVAISRLLGCRGVAVLPAGMSEERFRWLGQWVAAPSDVIRTPGTESNVKEIYDKCAQLAADPENVILNQFCEFGNYLAHAFCTAPALSRVYETLAARAPGLRLAAFVAATGSAGTLGAGDVLKARHGTKIVAAEAAECPTLLDNGFGEHNIQGIGDKHVPLIHNVMNTDAVAAVSDHSTDSLHLLFQTDVGRDYLQQRQRLPAAFVKALEHLGPSGICNVLAAIATARHFDLGPEDLILTVATDGAALYGSELDKIRAKRFPGGFDIVHAGEVFGQHLRANSARLCELTHEQRKRVFNLGYFTWVEQQGLSADEFDQRRSQAFWTRLHQLPAAWDQAIEETNGRTGVLAQL